MVDRRKAYKTLRKISRAHGRKHDRGVSDIDFIETKRGRPKKNHGIMLKKISGEDWVFYQGERRIRLSDVKRLASIGVDKVTIANFLGFSRRQFNQDRLDANPDLKKIFEECEKGLSEGIVRVTTSLFKVAADPDHYEKSWLGAAMFWLKNRAGWRDQIEQHTVHGLDQTLADLLREGYERRKQTKLIESNRFILEEEEDE